LTVIYISYDGMLEPLGQSQVVAYLEQLARDWPVNLISFEKERDRKDESECGHARALAGCRHRLDSACIPQGAVGGGHAYDIAVGAATALSY